MAIEYGGMKGYCKTKFSKGIYFAEGGERK